ncbi:MAG: hypothetical protein JPMHGGIA_00926 [Saprospiraceae bacterium]|nr:hypothetical protein [Saprospiraceae bacterium]
MKTSAFQLAFILCFLQACSYPRYLPKLKDIDVNEYGAAIRVVRKDRESVSGELIHADHAKIIVLTDKERKCKSIPIRDIKNYTLRYAKSRNYYWTTALLLALPAINGIYVLFTGPIHLVGALSVAMGSERAFTYHSTDMRAGELRLFARYPQGLPPNVELNQIK